MMALRLVIRGRVQGVGYRDWMRAEAEALGVHGWVRNRGDGTVEALIHGEADLVARLLRACRRGPRFAEVGEIAEHPADAPDTVGFRRLPDA